MRAAILFSMTLLAGCAMTPAEMESARQGHDDAERDVLRGRPREAYIGFVRDDESPLDPKTGRVRFSVACCKSRERIAYVNAYADVMDDALSARRVATFEKKATTRDAVAARFEAGAGVETRIGGRAVDSPDGRFQVGAGPASGVYGVALWSTDKTSGARDELRLLGGAGATVVFDETGTTLFVKDEGARCFATFDLPTALPLQVFPLR